MPSAEDAPSLRHAVALGLLQGPTELLPISSSAHTTLVPWLAGWPYARMDGERR
jgi:undecaprenyl-diphosphatase